MPPVHNDWNYGPLPEDATAVQRATDPDRWRRTDGGGIVTDADVGDEALVLPDDQTLRTDPGGSVDLTIQAYEAAGRLSGPVTIGGETVDYVNIPTGTKETVTIQAGTIRRTGVNGERTEVRVGGDIAGAFIPTVSDPEAWDADLPYRDDQYAEIDPSNYSMVVNADTQSGVALAPSAIRQGITADPGGTEVDLSDGTTVTVYPRQESDEAIRDPSTGEPIDSPVGSGGVDGGLDDGDDGGMIGAAVAAVVLLVAGAAALLGGGE